MSNRVFSTEDAVRAAAAISTEAREVLTALYPGVLDNTEGKPTRYGLATPLRTGMQVMNHNGVDGTIFTVIGDGGDPYVKQAMRLLPGGVDILPNVTPGDVVVIGSNGRVEYNENNGWFVEVIEGD